MIEVWQGEIIIWLKWAGDYINPVTTTTELKCHFCQKSPYCSGPFSPIKPVCNTFSNMVVAGHGAHNYFCFDSLFFPYFSCLFFGKYFSSVFWFIFLGPFYLLSLGSNSWSGWWSKLSGSVLNFAHSYPYMDPKLAPPIPIAQILGLVFIFFEKKQNAKKKKKKKKNVKLAFLFFFDKNVKLAFGSSYGHKH